MAQTIAELMAKALRSEGNLEQLLAQEAKVKIKHGRGFGHITVAHRIVAWYDRKRLEYALRRQRR